MRHYAKKKMYKGPNSCIALNNCKIGILLTKNQITVIDANDYGLIQDYRLYASYAPSIKGFYAIISIRQGKKYKKIRLHRVLMNVLDSIVKVDHRNHDTLDNTRNNLRICNNSENNCNVKVHINNLSTGIKNIYMKKNGDYRVQIKIGGIRQFDRTFKTLEEAIEHKRKILFEKRIHGDFANDG